MSHRRALVLGALAASLCLPSTAFGLDEVNSKKLRDAVTVNGILQHERALQAVANANGGTRASGTPGYEASLQYVKQRLVKAGYRVKEQEFTFPFFEERSPPRLLSGPAQTPAPSGELRTLFNSGAGVVTARLRAVDLGLPERADPGAVPAASTSACEASDFDGFERGAIALVRRGACTFQAKVHLAAAAGAAGIIVMNEGAAGRTDAMPGRLDASPIPVVGVSFALGRRLEPTDMPAVRRVIHGAAAHDYRLSSFILGVAGSSAFQMNTSVAADTTVAPGEAR